MKHWIRVLLIGCVLAMAGAARSQPSAPKDIQAREMDLLRKTLAEQQAHPGEIIRTPQTLAFSTNAMVSAARLELERQYLAGKITAKQFQKSLEQLQDQERRQALTAARVVKPEPAVPKTGAAPAPSPTTTAKPSAPPAAAAAGAGATSKTNTTNQAAAPTTSEPKSISDVENKLDEMLRLKAERDKAATNTTGAAKAPAGPLTKRDRLNALLKQHIDGKLSSADYEAQRAKLIAEPD